jgi:2-phospho-L-lactate transferase/gluconeogenesis factor (CofD/UPF0052 family)
MDIVTLGNGTGQATLLYGLRDYACGVTAIVGVTDNGGHSGQLRRLLHMPQVGDTRQCLSALLDAESVWGHLLRHRFTEGELCGMSVGNLILAALAQRHGSLHAAVADVRQAAGLRQRVFPVSDGETHIGAELIVRLFLDPPVAAHPAALEAIAQADLCVICPGSFLTGTIGVLLHPGVREALTASRAPCIYVCNLMTQPGQTDGYTARQHVAVLTAYLGRHVEAVVLNNGPLPEAICAIYAQQGAYPVVQDLTGADVPLYCADLVARPDAATLHTYARPQGPGMDVGLHLMRHDPGRLAAQIMAIAVQPPARLGTGQG